MIIKQVESTGLVHNPVEGIKLPSEEDNRINKKTKHVKGRALTKSFQYDTFKRQKTIFSKQLLVISPKDNTLCRQIKYEQTPVCLADSHSTSILRRKFEVLLTLISCVSLQPSYTLIPSLSLHNWVGWAGIIKSHSHQAEQGTGICITSLSSVHHQDL